MLRLLNSFSILLVLRDKVANDWPSLCQAFGRDPDSLSTDTLTLVLHESLRKLRDFELVDFEDDAQAVGRIRGEIRITEHWTRLHKALGGQSLKDLARLDRDLSMVVTPRFRPPKAPRVARDLFVAMPFKEPHESIWANHIKPVAESLGLTAAPASDIFSAQAVMLDVWNAICASRAMIADCTGRNPNVFYEIGLAHVVGVPVVLVTQDKDDVPFDVADLRFIEYEYTPPGMKRFENQLRETLDGLDLS